MKLEPGFAISKYLLAWEEARVRAVEGKLNAHDRCRQNVQLTCFDFLEVARTDLGALGELLLSKTLRAPLASDVCPEGGQSLTFLLT